MTTTTTTTTTTKRTAPWSSNAPSAGGRLACQQHCLPQGRYACSTFTAATLSALRMRRRAIRLSTKMFIARTCHSWPSSRHEWSGNSWKSSQWRRLQDKGPTRAQPRHRPPLLPPPLPPPPPPPPPPLPGLVAVAVRNSRRRRRRRRRRPTQQAAPPSLRRLSGHAHDQEQCGRWMESNLSKSPTW